MYQGFNVKFPNELSDFKDLPVELKKVNLKTYDCDLNKVIESCYFESGNFNDFVLDGNKLRDICFPKGKPHVFISHSHKDIELVKFIAVILDKALGLHCFVDSSVWMNFEILLNKIDRLYCYNEDTPLIMTKEILQPLIST